MNEKEHIEKKYYTRYQFSHTIDVKYEILVSWENVLGKISKNGSKPYCSILKNNKRYFEKYQVSNYVKVKRMIEIDGLNLQQVKSILMEELNITKKKMEK